MRYYIYILTIIICLPFFSCEKIITDVEVPYEEEIVICGILEAGMSVKNIKVTKTLPPLHTTSFDSACYIPDAEVMIFDGDKSYSLKYLGGSIYGTDSLTAISGKEYQLIVNWHGKKVTASTCVPDFCIPDDVTFELTVNNISSTTNPSNDSTHILKIFIEINATPGNSLYFTAASAKLINNKLSDISYINSVAARTDTLPDGKLKFRAQIYLIYWNGAAYEQFFYRYIKERAGILETYSKEFYNYYVAKNNGIPEEETVFPIGNKQFGGNVSGDGFGIFLGRATVSMQATKAIIIW